MNRNEYHPHSGAGLHAEHIVQTSAVSFGRSVRRLLVARAVLIALLSGSLGAGALMDVGLRWLGLRWPPVFSLAWGIGAFVLISLAWARLELRAAQDRDTRPREED